MGSFCSLSVCCFVPFLDVFFPRGVFPGLGCINLVALDDLKRRVAPAFIGLTEVLVSMDCVIFLKDLLRSEDNLLKDMLRSSAWIASAF